MWQQSPMADNRMTQIDSGQSPDDLVADGAMLRPARIVRMGESVILFDGSLVHQPDPAWFDPRSWPQAATAPGGTGRGGRGVTLFIEVGSHRWVLRHYHRGGAIADLATDGFMWTGQARVRSFAEWRLLDRLCRAGLPVPRPVAARYVRRGIVYRADLITVRIPGVVTLSSRLARDAVDPALWHAVGACIGRFHRAGIYHADLSAHNIQVDENDRIFLLDFDRGRVMQGAGDWQLQNLQRLHRSLVKISGSGAVRFADPQWSGLLAGYRDAMTAAPDRVRGETSCDKDPDSPPADP